MSKPEHAESFEAISIEEWFQSLAATSSAFSPHSTDNDAAALTRSLERSYRSFQHSNRRPDAPKPKKAEQEIQTWLRALGDRTGLKKRFHEKSIHHQHCPHQAEHQDLYDALENIRLDSLGQDWSGVAANLNALHQKECLELTRSIPKDQDLQMLLSERLDLVTRLIPVVLRSRMCGSPVPGVIEDVINTLPQDDLEWIESFTPRLIESKNDQSKFSREVVRMIQAWPRMQSHTEGESDETNSPDTQEEEDADFSRPDEQRLEGTSQGESDETMVGADLDSKSEAKTSEEGTQPWWANTIPSNEEEHLNDYPIYTRQFDRVVPAQHLIENKEELFHLRTTLDDQLQDHRATISRLARRLQRFILGQRRSWWELDQEEGYLDPSRLTRIVSSPLNPYRYRNHREIAVKDTIVSILLDNSGSMRGAPIMIACLSAEIISRTLEICGVATEILGYTTSAWKGGESAKLWRERGSKPAQPGRINDLLHIIYKSAEQPFRRARSGLALMLKDGLLKENIDGEALHWAYHRLLLRNESRRILLIISDGAPVDDSTLSLNGAMFLDKHLHRIIRGIESDPRLSLCAIGIGHNVARYYQNSITINDVRDLAETMVDKLTALLAEKRETSS